MVRGAKKITNGNNSIINGLIKYFCIPNHRAKVKGREPMYYPATKNILSLLDNTPDIIHLNNLHGKFFDLTYLPYLSHKIPTVVRLSDMWLFTGHCAHSLHCDKWKTGCGDCPDLSLYPSITMDATKINLRLKETILKKSKLYISAPSKWLLDKAKKSILRHAAIDYKVIPTGINLENYKPGDKDKIRNELGLSKNSKIIFIYASGASEYKSTQLLELLKKIERKNNNGINIDVLIIGWKKVPVKFSKLNIYTISYINNQNDYIGYLQASDLYVHLAMADTYPNSIMESLACGIPVVAFNIGGIPEQIIPINSVENKLIENNSSTGALINAGDIENMVNTILNLLLDDQKRTKISVNAVNYAKENFNFNDFANQYLNWYSKILSST